MQRSKQQALMFLLGALIVGGVLGFSADRVLVAKQDTNRPRVQRQSLYELVKATPEQQVKIDSILEEANCATDELMKPIRPALDSLKKQASADWRAVLTPDQHARLDSMEARQRARQDSIRKVRAAERAAKEKENPTAAARQRKCGGGFGRAPGIGSSGVTRPQHSSREHGLLFP